MELDIGQLVAFMRDREAYRINRSELYDWGETWSEPVPTNVVGDAKILEQDLL